MVLTSVNHLTQLLVGLPAAAPLLRSDLGSHSWMNDFSLRQQINTFPKKHANVVLWPHTCAGTLLLTPEALLNLEFGPVNRLN